MSCHLETLCSLSEVLVGLKSALYPGKLLDEELFRDDDWDNRWSWDPAPQPLSGEETVQFSRKGVNFTKQEAINGWLNQCFISICPPFGDIVAFGVNRELAILRMKPREHIEATPEAKPVPSQVQMLCGTSLEGLTANETITAILCLPLVSQQKSNQGSKDWTAIVVGFSSGFLRVYTENGCLLLAQKMHEEPINSINCQTFYSDSANGRSVHPQTPDQPDEITIFFKTVAVVVDGFALYQTLRSCRNYLARTQSTVGSGSVNCMLELGIALPYKKWSFKEQGQISDCGNGGLVVRSLYDHLVTQSYSGPYGGPKKNKSLSTLLVTVGESPFVGFYQASEDESPTILNEMAQAVVSKVKNIIPLFGSGGKSDEKAKTDNPIALQQRVGLFDQNREGLKICFSPNKRLAAVSDEFGRVTLIDINQWVVIRMWKGYRDAQCGWIESAEDPVKTCSRKATFLVIYAPKRGIVEVWRCQQGPRVAAFNVSKSCKLLYCNYCMLGLNHILLQQANFNLSPAVCYLFDASTALVHTLDIPFVCTLNDQNSILIRDSHLLKEVQAQLTSTNSDGKFLSSLLDIQSMDTTKEALYNVISTNNSSVVKNVAKTLRGKLLSQDLTQVDSALSYESKSLVQMCSRIAQLCQLFDSLKDIVSDLKTLPLTDFLNEPPQDIENLATALSWKPNDVAKCISLFSLRYSVLPATEQNINSFVDLTLSQFLSCFSVEENHIRKSPEGDALLENVPIDVKWSLDGKEPSNSSLAQVADFIFQPIITSSEDVFALLQNSCIKSDHLLRLLYKMWLSRGYSFNWKNWEIFSTSAKMLSEKLDEDVEDCLLSSSWKSICCMIVESPNLPAALIATYVTKMITSRLGIKTVSEPTTESSDNEWETLSLDEERLNLLIKQLDDTFLLDLLLKSDRKQETDDISLAFLLRSNSGIVSELVAKWAVRAFIQPSAILAFGEEAEAELLCRQRTATEVAADAISCDTNLLEEETVKELLGHVRRCFPYSLEPDVLLANCSWEALVQWDKCPSVGNCLTLRESIRYLNCINSAVLKHNIACLMWKTFICKKFETLAGLMEKMGKVPKERICKKDMGMGEDCLEPFVQYIYDLSDLILQNVRIAEYEGQPLFYIDEWWRQKAASGARMPLVFMAVHLKAANSSLVSEHSHLALSILLIITFQLKAFRPLSLFSSQVKNSLFKELHATSYSSSSDSDFTLCEARTKFLLSATSAVAQSLPRVEKSDTNELIPCQSTLHSQANQWFGKVIGLAREWSLNLDEIRRRFICELYANGSDSLAEEVINSVVDRVLLALEMLTIAGHRVLAELSRRNQKVTTLPPNVAYWLQNLGPDEKGGYVSKEATEFMLQHILNFLPEENAQYKVGCALLEGLVNT